MPNVDLATGKIVGCKEGTLSWYHEEGHIAFSNTEKGVTYSYLGDAFIKGAVILLAFNLLFANLITRIFIYCFVVASIFLYFYEEIWCWLYALNKFKEVKNLNNAR